jgi:hypothetical protein
LALEPKKSIKKTIEYEVKYPKNKRINLWFMWI